MKRLILIVSLIAILFSYPMNVLASNIVNAIYRGTIVVTNNGTSAASSVSANMTLSSADLISQGYVTSNFSNAAIRNNTGSDVPFMPSVNSSYPWMMWVPSIAGNSITNYVLYAGGPDMSSTKSYFPAVVGANVTDSASLELSSNWSMPISGYFDTSVSGNISSKAEAYRFYTGSGNITGEIDGITNPTNIWNADFTTGAYTEIPYASTRMANFRVRFQNNDAAPQTVFLVEVQVWDGSAWVLATSSNGTGWVNLSNAYDNNTVTAATYNIPNGTFSNYAYFTIPTTNSTKMRYYVNRASVNINIMQLDIFPVVQTSVAVASGEYLVTPHSDGVNFWINAGSSSSANVTTATVPDNANPIYFFQGGSVPYSNYQKIFVGGNLKGSWQWQYSTNFTDLSGNGNMMYPSFPTTGSNPNVQAALSTFGLVNQANAPPYTVTNPQAFYSTNVTMTGNFSSGNVTGSGLPGSTLVDDAARAAQVPNVFLWGLFGGLFLVAGGFLISAISRFWGAGNGELIARIIWGIFVIGVLIALGKFDMWMLWFYLILTIAMALASRHNEVGAYFSELNFIGFLSMAEVGMITINRILEGSFINSADASQFNNLMFTQQFTILNVFTLPIVNFDFFTKGLPNLLKWNYVMFGGNAQMIQYLLYALTAIMGFIIFGLVIGTLSHYFTK